MTPEIITELQWLGVSIAPGQSRTTCPHCSPYRLKQDERCLRIYARDDGVFVRCWHCGWEASA
jgi:RNase P subunit RPR2